MFFRNIVGQESIKRQLVANVQNNRTSHTLLFLGPEGSGHLPLALALAQYIQCRGRGPEDACGTCPSCLKIKKLEHPDLHFFFPVAPNQEHKKDVSSKLFYTPWRELLLQSPYFSYVQWLEKIGIENKQAIINAEDCNEIIRVLGLKSYESPYKIVIIYMVEKLYHAAAPKLLKILEEPPEKTLFILVSENKDLVLNTILSRAQIMKVPRLGEEDIEQALSADIPRQQARQISFFSGGNFAEALRLKDQGADQLAGLEQFRSWMRLCFKNDWPNILSWVDTVSKLGREKQKTFLQYGLNTFRMCMMNNYHADDLMRLEGEEKKFVAGLSSFINHHTTIQVVEAFNTALMHIERNANPKILFSDLSFTLVKLFVPFKK
ncbi:MAG: DNA polymerase III subunit delta [Bacteroidales bacterium]